MSLPSPPIDLSSDSSGGDSGEKDTIVLWWRPDLPDDLEVRQAARNCCDLEEKGTTLEQERDQLAEQAQARKQELQLLQRERQNTSDNYRKAELKVRMRIVKEEDDAERKRLIDCIEAWRITDQQLENRNTDLRGYMNAATKKIRQEETKLASATPATVPTSLPSPVKRS
jgi:hypothetical protein